MLQLIMSLFVLGTSGALSSSYCSSSLLLAACSPGWQQVESLSGPEWNGFESLPWKKTNVTKRWIVCSWVNELNQLSEGFDEH